jgi:hypothetical protein
MNASVLFAHMKTITVFLFVLLVVPTGVSAAALYDGSELYVQAVLDADVDIGLGDEATSSGDTTSAHPTASTSVGVQVGGIDAAVDVATDADLSTYGAHLEASDANIAEAKAEADGEVMLTYYHPVRLFGVIPMRANAKTIISLTSAGTVEIETHLPWWAAFTTGAGSVASSIDAELSNSGQVMSDMKLSANASARARVLEAVANAHARALVRAAGS